MIDRGLSVLRRIINSSPLLGRIASNIIRLLRWREDRLASRYDRWITRNDTLSEAMVAAIRQRIAGQAERVSISVLIPALVAGQDALAAAVASLRAQFWPDWTLYLCGARETGTDDPRVRCISPRDALPLARGDWIMLLQPSDRLAPHALYEIAMTATAHPGARIIYADEDRLDRSAKRFDPYFKSDFDPDLLASQDMMGSACAWRTDLLRQVKWSDPGMDAAARHALAIEAATLAGVTAIHHIPRILCHRHAPHPGTTAGRAEWPVPHPPPLVSIIVPTRDKAELLRPSIEGLLHRTNYAPIEILIADNGSTEADTLALFRLWQADPRVRVLPVPGPFNYARINNQAATEASGKILLLLNNDTEVIGPDWLREMVSQVTRPGVGAVGAKLLYENGTIQHAGILLGVSWRGGGVGGHIYRGEPGDSAGPFGLLSAVRSVSAVTAACLAVRRDRFLEVGGLDEDNLAVDFNDVDLCLRLRAAGYRNVWTPFAVLYHKESASRGTHLTPEQTARRQAETAFMRRRWAKELDNDPYWNPNLSLAGVRRGLAYRPRVVEGNDPP